LHYKVTHLGTDNHGTGGFELPCLYVLKGFDRLVVYTGLAPWTGAPVSTPAVPSGATAANFLKLNTVTERWAAYVNASDFGVALWTPLSYPIFLAHDFDVTNYVVPSRQDITLSPGAVIESDAYVYVGDYKNARQAFNTLHATVISQASDGILPLAAIALPHEAQTVSGNVQVAGWAFDNVTVDRVEVYVDGVLNGTAQYGLARADVQAVYPAAPLGTGWSYNLDSRLLPNGAHAVTVKVWDAAGHPRVFAVNVQVAN
jgi:hypothetical protein